MSPYSGPRFFINQTAHLELTLPIPFFIVSFWEIQWLVHSRLVCVPACRLWGRLVAYWTSCLPRWDRSLPSSVSDQEPSSEAPPSNPLASFRCQLGCYTFTVGKVPPHPPQKSSCFVWIWTETCYCAGARPSYHTGLKISTRLKSDFWA